MQECAVHCLTNRWAPAGRQFRLSTLRVRKTQSFHENREFMKLRYTTGGMARSESRSRFALVLRHSGEVVTLGAIAEALGLDRSDASKIASRWVAQGRLIRLRPGVFAPVPLDSAPGDTTIADPWVLVPELFGTAYVTGWSAAEHWHLTDQLFRRICVKTAKQVRGSLVAVRDAEFFVSHVSEDLLFGLSARWIGQKRVSVADPHRTVVDMLDDPRLGGGARHISDCLTAYLRSEHASPETIIEYAERIDNGAVFKRLGFLAERTLPADDPLLAACRERLSAGYAHLDAALAGDRIITRWRLRVPRSLAREARDR